MKNSNNDVTDLTIYEDKYVALSNALIQAREKTSLLESKIELLAIYRMSDDMHSIEKVDADGNVYNVHAVNINSTEIRQLIGRKGGSLYGQIEAAALELKQKLYIYRDPGENQFKMQSLYGDVTYKDGRLTVEFNPATEYLFMELKDNFTKIKLDIAFKFTTNGGFQLYKLLKSYAYTLGDINPDMSQEEQKTVTKKYSLSELRLQLGYIDLNQPEIKKEGSKKNPDVEKMSELERKPKYKRWADFYNRVIEPGVREINDISDIYISEIKTEKIAHGKVESVLITIQNNRDFYMKHNEVTESIKTNDVIVEPGDIDEFIDEMRSFILENLKIKELKQIAAKAGYNIEKIKKAYSVADTYSRDINNLTSFLLKAIEEDYEPAVKKESNTKKHKSESSKTKFSNFTERSYDYDELINDIKN